MEKKGNKYQDSTGVLEVIVMSALWQQACTREATNLSKWGSKPG